MTSKNLSFDLMKEELKRRLWALALSMLAFFFALPVTYGLVISNNAHSNYLTAVDTLEESTQAVLGYGNPIVVGVVVVIAFICGLSSFYYLHSRKKVDFYHALPVSRKTMFWVNYLGGICIFFFSYVVNLCIATIMSVINGTMNGEMGLVLLQGAVVHTVYFLLIYTVAVLSAILTGNLVVNFLMVLGMSFYGNLVMSIYILSMDEFFHSFCASYSGIWDYALNLSPITGYIQAIGQMMKTEIRGGWMYILVPLACMAVLTALSRMLYCRRPSEAAGKALAFERMKLPLKVLVVVPLSLGSGLFFYVLSNGNNRFWYAFGLVVGCVLLHGLMEVIYQFDIHRLFKNLQQMGMCGLLVAVFALVLLFDITGYDSSLPKQENVSSVSLVVSDMDNYVEYFDEQSSGYQSKEKYLLDEMRLADLDTIYPILENAVSTSQSVDGYDGEMPERIDQIYVRMRMKNGRSVTKQYWLDKQAVKNELNKVFDSAEYKKTAYPILSMSESQIAKIAYGNYEEGGVKIMDQTEEERTKLFTTFQKEFQELTAETMETSYPIGWLSFGTKTMSRITDDGAYKMELERRYCYPVYESFTETLAVLKEQGINLKWQISASQVLRVVVIDNNGPDEDYSYESSTASYDEKTTQESENQIITDQEQIAQLLPLFISETANYMNSLGNADETRLYQIDFVDRQNHTGGAYYYLPKDKVPDFIQ